ncbi:MAG: DUF4294 domain-containing protein [Rikenellaceae bacterium]
MKQRNSIILTILLSISWVGAAFGAKSPPPPPSDEPIEVRMKPIIVFERGIDRRRYWRLVNSVKRVYPLAKVAREKIAKMEEQLDSIGQKRDQRELVRSIYKEIKAEYTPVLLKMSMTDGRVLIRLIDRETDYTAYEVLDEFKGGFTASMWQGVSRLFGHNLKSEYGSSAEDKMIEKIIRYYEAGLL